MTWREALDEAADAAAVERLDGQVADDEAVMLQRLQLTLDDQGDAAAAAPQVRALMFVARFREDIQRRLEALDA
jgi:molecular chaperone HscB